MFVNGNHWVCVNNTFSRDSVDLYDSLHTIPEVDGTIARQVSCITVCPNPSFDLNIINVQCHDGYSDCGLYALAMAFDLCAGSDPFETIYNQQKIRSHLFSCFELGDLTAFPSVKQKGNKQRVLHISSVEVFCVCRQPKKLPMTCCDSCSEQFQNTCVSIPQAVYEDDDVPWTCVLREYM